MHVDRIPELGWVAGLAVGLILCIGLAVACRQGERSPGVRALSRDEYLATFDHPMIPLSEESVPPFDFWPYVEAIPTSAYEGFDYSEGEVDHVWRTQSGAFDHVLINTDVKNVFLVIVLDLERSAVYGHYLLDLREEYGLPKSPG